MSPTDVSGAEGSGGPFGRHGARMLSTKGLTKAFGNNQVLKGIDVDVRRGQVVALIGPSGSGKTTVLRSLNGLEIPDGGTLTIAGSDGDPGLSIDFAAKVGKRERAALRDRSAMVFQHY